MLWEGSIRALHVHFPGGREIWAKSLERIPCWLTTGRLQKDIEESSVALGWWLSVLLPAIILRMTGDL